MRAHGLKNVLVEAIDRNRGTLEHSTMIINVADENDNIPIFTAASTILKCPENARNGASCGNVQALDKDSGAFGRVEYFRPDQKEQWKKRDGSFENDREYGMFNVDKESGEITLNNPTNWDAETYEYVVITVQARDNPNKGGIIFSSIFFCREFFPNILLCKLRRRENISTSEAKCVPLNTAVFTK